ncbi:hypothetical protein TELCIR_12767, partial [Teladorsagia circumcincta]
FILAHCSRIARFILSHFQRGDGRVGIGHQRRLGQCKHCPIYQYMSGCVNLTPWQMADIEVSCEG